MRCKYCSTDIAVGWSVESKGLTGDSNHEPEDENVGGYKIMTSNCPNCNGLIVKIEFGQYSSSSDIFHSLHDSEIVYPIHSIPDVDDRIDEPYKSDFSDAIRIKDISPKASSMLARSILEEVLEKEYGLENYKLSNKVSDFIDLQEVPINIREAVDAVREVGNLGAHLHEDDATGKFVDVETAEVEVALTVLRQLLEYTFKPSRREEQIRSLNEKLDKIGRDGIQQPEDDD